MRRQQRLKAASGTAWAEVVPPEFFEEFFFSVNDSSAALNLVSDGYPLRRLLVRSKGGMCDVFVSHGKPPVVASILAWSSWPI